MIQRFFGLTILGLVAVLLASAAISFAREGHAWGFVLPGDRKNSPVLFWSCVAACAAMAVAILGVALALALQPTAN
jgi:hypothetical protein